MDDQKGIVRRLYSQARMMTLGMASSVVAYGAIGYYLIQMGKGSPAILSAQNYPLFKYGTLAVSIFGIFMMEQLRRRTLDPFRQAPAGERPPQRLFVQTVLMSAGAELPLLLGMLLVFLGRNPHDFIPFAAISLAGFAFAFPKKQQWVEWLGFDF